MAAYQPVSAYDTVQVKSANAVIDAMFCTIQTNGHGAIVNRTIPKSAFGNGGIDVGLLNSLASAVDGILDGGLATYAAGVQDVDASGLIYDAVEFTVEYALPNGEAGPWSTTVTVPVNVITADTQFGSFLSGGSAVDRLQAAYADLQALAGQ